MPTLDELIEAAEVSLERRTQRKIDFYTPYPKQQEFIEATVGHQEVLFQTGNQHGKTTTAAAFTSYAATGVYPDWYRGRRWDRPVKIWVSGESSAAVRDNIQDKLCGAPGNPEAFGTGYIPRSLLASYQLGHGTGGGFDKIAVKHASGGLSEIFFKSYDQDVAKWQGATLDLIWFDEMPPLKHYSEGLARLIATNGLAIITATPLIGSSETLARFSERSEEALRNRITVRGRLVDVPHLQDSVRLARLKSTWDEDEMQTRLDGVPMLGSGKVFKGIKTEDILVPLRLGHKEIVHDQLGPLDTSTWAFLWGMDFGFSHPFAAVLVGWDKDNDIVYVLAEVKVKGAGPPVHASRLKLIAPSVKVAWPHDGQQTDKGSATQLKDFYKREGLNMLGQWATWPTGGYGLEEGIMEMQVRMQSGRLKVSTTCLEWRAEFETYHRKDGLIVKVNDDLLSATRVALMDLRYAAGYGSAYNNPTQQGPKSYIAEGTNDNPLDWYVA